MSKITANQAVELLKRGDVVALPTETVYGLAGRIDSDQSLLRIFETKRRPFFDPLIVHVLDATAARALWSEWPEIFDSLTERFWPGPLTLIAKKSAEVSSLITSGLETVAVRAPQHPIMREILKQVGVPLAAPSANRFGHVSPTRANHVQDEFDGQVPVVDGGDSEVGVESTVVAVERQTDGGWSLMILRPGGVSREALQEHFRQRGENVQVERKHSHASPGHLKAHYQPDCPLVLVENKPWDAALQKRVQELMLSPLTTALPLELGTSPARAARELYQNMRVLASGRPDILYVVRTRDNSGPEWEAIWDRLERASSFTV